MAHTRTCAHAHTHTKKSIFNECICRLYKAKDMLPDTYIKTFKMQKQRKFWTPWALHACGTQTGRALIHTKYK